MGNIIPSTTSGSTDTISGILRAASVPITATWGDVSDPKRLKPQSSTTAADTSLIFSDDLLLEIFLRLPHAQSLLRCTAVCKRWRHLVSSDGFDQRFNLYHRNDDGRRYSRPYSLVVKYGATTCHLLFSESSKALHAVNSRGLPGYLDFVPAVPESVPEVLASCEDLLLIKPFFDGRPTGPYFLCNPLTRQTACLPPPPAIIRWSYALISATNSATGHACFYVFMFHRGNVAVGPNSIYTYDVFCSDKGVWDQGTIAVTCIRNSVRFCPKGSAFMTQNGVMHVPITREGKFYDGLFLAFDPFSAEERKRGRYVGPGLETARPRSRFIQRNFFWGLNEGRLRLTHFFGRKRAFLKIWELSYDHNNNADLGSWAVIHNAEVKRLPNAKDMSVKGLHPNDSAVVFLVNNREDIYEYDFEKEEYRKVGQFPSGLNPAFNRRYYSHIMKSFALVYPAWPTPINKLIAKFSL